MSEYTLYGIIEFSTPLYCSADALGQTVDVSIGGHAGTLTLPSLPDWHDQDKDPLHKPLLGPSAACTWKRGERLIYWGRPRSYPMGEALVECALLEFVLHRNNLQPDAQQIYKSFGAWLNLFQQYVILLTTQNTRRDTYVEVEGEDNEIGGKIELIISEEAGLRHISSDNSINIIVSESGVDQTLHLEQLKKASHLSSQKFPPRLEYRLLLEAYNARKNGDFRKTIIEAANALEISLTDRILDEFDKLHVSFGEKLVKKFSALGGRFELARILSIALPKPKEEYIKLVINPRNDVIHRASFPDILLANQVISEVEELLQLLSPQIYQD
ncbi:MAG: hypothetical protein HC889_07765 [Synechococcaceae cyanobacterium SM1_2_3]|nr:hypothetical protein [Synechococcaceae cyanobacterium SM1_2_3]